MTPGDGRPPMPEDISATRGLRQEHQLILKVLGAFERVIDEVRAQPGKPTPPELEAVDDCLAFFRLFADACHHGQEEDVLFEELVDRGMPREVGPIAVMLVEHEQGRALVRAMTAALERASGGDEVAWSVLERAARDYVALLRGHIMKEDGVLFEMADRLIAGPACHEICERYHTVCLEKLEGRTRLELEKLAASLVERFPPP
jgi:hemerythrin-like domain-containing protein